MEVGPGGVRLRLAREAHEGELAEDALGGELELAVAHRPLPSANPSRYITFCKQFGRWRT